jgi:hypothetical protein
MGSYKGAIRIAVQRSIERVWAAIADARINGDGLDPSLVL